MDIYLDVLTVVFLLLSLFIKINAVYIIIALYFVVNILRDSRRPVFVDAIGDIMAKKERVTTLSIDSQFKALFVAIFAPVFGFIADKFSISVLFLFIGRPYLCYQPDIKLSQKTGYDKSYVSIFSSSI